MLSLLTHCEISHQNNNKPTYATDINIVKEIKGYVKNQP